MSQEAVETKTQNAGEVTFESAFSSFSVND